MPAEPRPLRGQVVVDAQMRSLRITRVRVDDPLGREVSGVISEGGVERPYSCSAQMFRDVWVERTPATTFEQQEQVRKSLKV